MSRSAHDRQIDVESLLFGNMLVVTPGVLKVVVVVAVLGLAVTLALWSRLAYAIFDPELAAISGVPVGVLRYLLLVETAVVVVVAVKTVGVVLVSSFVVIPAATARLIGQTLARHRARPGDRYHRHGRRADRQLPPQHADGRDNHPHPQRRVSGLRSPSCGTVSVAEPSYAITRPWSGGASGRRPSAAVAIRGVSPSAAALVDSRARRHAWGALSR